MVFFPHLVFWCIHIGRRRLQQTWNDTHRKTKNKFSWFLRYIIIISLAINAFNKFHSEILTTIAGVMHSLSFLKVIRGVWSREMCKNHKCANNYYICANILPSNVQTTTFVQTRRPQMCKSVFKKNTSTTVQTWRRQMCKGSILTWNVQTSHKIMCK